MRKVYLFNVGTWLYCDIRSCENNNIRGSVINGQWNFRYDESRKIMYHEKGENPGMDMIWACNPVNEDYDYGTIIENAKVRFESGEEANWDIL